MSSDILSSARSMTLLNNLSIFSRKENDRYLNPVPLKKNKSTAA